jgi:hypothetical protein
MSRFEQIVRAWLIFPRRRVKRKGGLRNLSRRSRKKRTAGDPDARRMTP